MSTVAPAAGQHAVIEHQVHIRVHSLPGIGRVYEMPLDSDCVLSLVVDARTGERVLSALRTGDDEPALTLRLDEDQALALSTLMGGVRLEVEPDTPKGAVGVDTVLVGAGSPVVGQTLSELHERSDESQPSVEEARIIAVIRDDTPELLEADPTRICQPGDRLVLAGRPSGLADLRRWVLG